MRILSIICVLFFLTCSTYGQRQSVLKTNKDVYGYTLVPQEKIFIHYNTSLLFSGEYFYYRVYCFNAKSNALSTISKVAYLVLLDEDEKAVFKHKISLENGLGQGDFFVPVSIPSGNYKLIGYTQWMLNEASRFFQADISILNPYQGNQSKILSADIAKDSLGNPITEFSKGSELINAPEENTKIDLKLTTDTKSYNKRSLVKLSIENSQLNTAEGNYSLSVRKKDVFAKALPVRAKDFSTLYSNRIDSPTKAVGTSIFLPEMRGELLYGKILPKETSFSVSEQSVGLSIPGKTSDVKVVLTDNKGNFVFNLNNRNDRDEVLIQVLGKDKENYTVQIFEIPEVQAVNLEFYQFKISPSLKDKIVKRSVYNQIDNVFYSVKPDTLQALTNAFAFHGTEIETYELDDYTRFGTVKETIVEVVESVWTKKDENENEVFVVRGYYPTVKKQSFLPLLVVDGVFVQDHESIINYDARKIKSISFIQDRYYLGPQIFEGVVIIETIAGDYLNSINTSAKITLSSLQASKKYFKQKYSDDKSNNKIPDFRNQLLWQPNVKMTKGKSSIEFYTSDVVGDFEICLEGFKDNGFPISIKTYITVE
ncbi:hypothetical protein [uncultured Aquimarina sp.]|uniref:hypothetical protein n=1 Tax=uncultured Aquimarina sp. TaxID=575652 RepID=UPI00261BFE1A|nr:hypothetical protein [uncultured Aquimarina sp.]